jgi:solute carrier family 25 phosphate transporter 23/24/25/41
MAEAPKKEAPVVAAAPVSVPKPVAPAPPKRYLPEWRHLASGAIAGGLSRTLTNPLERLKMLRQLQIGDYLGQSMGKALYYMGKSEGFYGMFKGNFVNVLKVVPFAACEFFFYEQFKQLIYGENLPKSSFIPRLICGSLSGMVSSIIIYPLEVIRTLLSIQTSKYQSDVMGKKVSIASVGAGVWKSAGFKGFYKGCVINVFGISPFIGIKLSLFDKFNSFFGVTRGHKMFDAINLLNGALATVVAGTVTYPSEYLKRLWQLRGIDKQVPNYPNFWECCKDIFRRDGVKGFFKGLNASNTKIVPANALLFFFNERIKKWWGVTSR